MRPLDTSENADEVYFQHLRKMTPVERINIAVALWEAADATQRAGIRQQYPNATEEEIRFEMAVRRFGAELAQKVYGRPS